jgi:hypothetical protein
MMCADIGNQHDVGLPAFLKASAGRRLLASQLPIIRPTP